MASYTMYQQQLPIASDLWYRKMRAFFNALDLDNNGYLSLRDKQRMTEFFIQANHRVQHSNAEKRFKIAMEDLWKMVEVKPKVTYEDYLSDRLRLLDLHLKDDKKCRQVRLGYYEMFFDFIDLDRNKKWDPEETAMYFSLLVRDKYNHEQVAKLFPLIDRDGDGMITFDEYACACYAFEFDQEPSKFDEIFGPLPSIQESKPKNPKFR